MARLNIPLFVALAASILSAVPVDARDAHPHQRMIRKRGPPVLDRPGPIGAAAVIGLRVRQAVADPTGSTSQLASSAPVSTTAVATTTREVTTSPTSAAAVSTTLVATSSTAAAVTTTSSSSSTSAAQPTTTSGGLLNSLTAILGSSTVSTSSLVSSTPVTSSTPTTAIPTSTSTTQVVAPSTTQQQQQPPAAETSPTLNIATPSPSATVRSPSVSVNVITSTQAAAEASASVAAAKEKTKKITRNTIVSLVVVASCIGGAIAIWTVIRKWKLSPSEKFDDRMQPIDWAPPPAHTEEAIEEKSKHRRAGSGASHGSFTSGGVGQSDQGHKYADSQQGHGYGPQSQDFPPPHDFTAGTGQPGGYGQYYGAQPYPSGPGYADLQRGPSLSESNYSRGADVSRGMSYSRGHGAYDSQSSAVPQMPNPYAGEYGYEDYNHPPAGQQPQVQTQAQTQGQAPYRTF